MTLLVISIIHIKVYIKVSPSNFQGIPSPQSLHGNIYQAGFQSSQQNPSNVCHPVKHASGKARLQILSYCLCPVCCTAYIFTFDMNKKIPPDLKLFLDKQKDNAKLESIVDE